jgi:hypothetical protein
MHAGAQVAKAGFTERGRRRGTARSTWLCLWPQAGGPAFATIHPRISILTEPKSCR